MFLWLANVVNCCKIILSGSSTWLEPDLNLMRDQIEFRREWSSSRVDACQGHRGYVHRCLLCLFCSPPLLNSTRPLYNLPSTTSLSSPPRLGVKPAHPRRRGFFWLKFCYFVVSAQLGEKQGIQKGSDDRVQVPRPLNPGKCTKHGVHQHRTWQWH